MRSRYPRRKSIYRGKTNLTLNHLLSHQAKTIQKHPHYQLMMSHYHSSEKLQSLKINRQCYRLLDRAIITIENLPNLYRTYRLPKDPFFPLFIKIKRDYLSDRMKKIEEREKYILTQMKKLPRDKRKLLRFLAEWEERITPSGKRQVWETKLYPSSKKKSLEMLNFDETEWTQLIDQYFESLKQYYQASISQMEPIRACLFLHLIPGLNPLTLPSRETVNKSYRKLSRSYHPDSGGQAALFIRLQKSKDLLLKDVQ